MKDLCLLFSCPCLRYCKAPSFRLCMPYTSLNTPYEVLIMGIKAPSPPPPFLGFACRILGVAKPPTALQAFRPKPSSSVSVPRMQWLSSFSGSIGFRVLGF